jgi:hypothetical protein
MILHIAKKIGKSVFSIFFIYCSFQSFAQKQEIGIGMGLSVYSGEIGSQRLDVRNFRPAGQAYYRINFSDVVSMRVAGSLGILSASDKNYHTPMANARQQTFTGNFNDVNIMLEYNFLNFSYKNEQDCGKLAPYFAAGLGFFSFSNNVVNLNNQTNTTFLPMIPIGGGFKYRVNAHWSINYQFVANKTFTTSIDGIYNPSGYQKSWVDSQSTEWYYYTGLSVGYTFWKVHCPKR